MPAKTATAKAKTAKAIPLIASRIRSRSDRVRAAEDMATMYTKSSAQIGHNRLAQIPGKPACLSKTFTRN